MLGERVHVHEATEKHIGRLFTSGLPRASRAKLLREVAGCKGCGEYYRRYHLLEAALTGSPVGMSRFARERVLGAILETVSLEEKPQKPVMGLKWALCSAAGAVMAALVLLLWPSAPDRDHRAALPDPVALAPIEGVAAKGHPVREAADVGIRLFKVSKRGDAVAEKDTLRLNDIITFTYTFARSHTGYLALFGIQETGDVRWYYPDYGQETSIRIEGEKVDEPLKDGIDLSRNHAPGWLRIVALFSDRPVSVSAVEGSISRLENRNDLKRLIPLSDAEYGIPTIQHSVIVEIGGSR